MKKIAVITGASSGMGRRFAETVTTWGELDDVWVIARSQSLLAKQLPHDLIMKVWMSQQKLT